MLKFTYIYNIDFIIGLNFSHFPVTYLIEAGCGEQKTEKRLLVNTSIF
jgi:hypothetical protein